MALISLDEAVRAARMVLFIALAMALERSISDRLRWALDISSIACLALT